MTSATVAADGTITFEDELQGDGTTLANLTAKADLSNVEPGVLLQASLQAGLAASFNNGTLGSIEWDENSNGEGRFKMRPDAALADPVTGDTTNPGGGRQSNFWFWHRRAGNFSGSPFYINVDFTNADPTTIDVKHSAYSQAIFAYNRQQAGTKVGKNGHTYWPQEIGGLAVRAVTAAGNATAKTEGIVAFVDHEDATAGGKLVVLQVGATPKDVDPGRNKDAEVADLDPGFDGTSLTPETQDSSDDGDGTSGAGLTYLIRGNFAGEVRGNTAINIRSGKKLGFHLPMYNVLTTASTDVYRGDRDASYVAGVDDPLPGRFIAHYNRSAINGWGWFGSGTDDPQFHADFRTAEAGEAITFADFNNDATSKGIARIVSEHRTFALNSAGDLIQEGPGTLTQHLVGTEFTRTANHVIDPAQHHEYGEIRFSTVQDGALAERVRISDGIYVGSLLGINGSGKLAGSQATTTKAAILAAANLAALQTALSGMFA